MTTPATNPGTRRKAKKAKPPYDTTCKVFVTGAYRAGREVTHDVFVYCDNGSEFRSNAFADALPLVTGVANLFAAAPELLAALRWALNILDMDYDEQLASGVKEEDCPLTPLMQQGCAAIRRATGERG